MKLIIQIPRALALFGLVFSAVTVSAAEKPEFTQAPPLPTLWQKVSARDRLNLVRAAELDAVRLLAERISGVQIDSKTTVSDLSTSDDKVSAAMSTLIRGVKNDGPPTFHEDGRVEVVKKLLVDQVIKTIKESYTRKDGGTLESTSQSDTDQKEFTLDALGSAAIKGSEGHKRIMAKRAAEIDAYRRLAERVGGVKINSKTTISGLATQSDEIRAQVRDTVKSAETIKIRYISDGSAEVTLRLRVGPLVRVIARKTKGDQITTISDEIKQLILEETGTGAAPDNSEIQVDVQIDQILEETLTGKIRP